MKTILFLLLLAPFSPSYQFKQLHFKLTTVDETGKPLSDCEVEVSSSGFLGIEKYISDKQGKCNISWQAMKSVAFVSRRRDYATQYLTFDNLDKQANGDTLTGVLVMKRTVPAKNAPAKTAPTKTTPSKTTPNKTTPTKAESKGK